MDLERLPAGLSLFSPDQRENLLVGKRPVGVAHQNSKNSKFLVRKRNNPSIESDFMASHIDHQPVKLSAFKGKSFVANRFNF